jgi:Ca-activated chloride channel family protein
MSFASPLWLLALALVPIAIAAYAAAQRRARRYAIRFPALASARLAVAETATSRLRHVPAVLLLAAVAALAVALAKPQVSYQLAVNEGSVVLVTDHSGSMAANDVQPSRLAAAEEAADSFIAKLPADIKVGVVAFSTIPDAVQAPASDHGAAEAIINSQQAEGSTSTGNALATALQLLHAGNPKHPPAAIVLLSDGAANAGQSPVAVAREAARDRIHIDTVALGTPNGQVNVGPFSPPVTVPPDPQLMGRIAAVSGGRSFNARSAGELNSVYRTLGRRLGATTREREVTVDFAIAGLVLLLAAVALGVRSAPRLP